MSPVAQSDRALNNETCKSLKQQVSSGLLNQRSMVRAHPGDFTKALAATLHNMIWIYIDGALPYIETLTAIIKKIKMIFLLLILFWRLVE